MRLELADTLPRVKIDPEKLRQVLMNLMGNALQAMDGRGKLTLRTATRRTGRIRSAASERALGARSESVPVSGRKSSTSEESELVEVSVIDTGPGISQKVLKNLFVPFFTTKTQGTGLGLAISQSIVQNAGGTIEVHTLAGEGTTFTVVLPAGDDALMTPTPGDVAVREKAPDESSPVPALVTRSASGP
jgi:signal transduction histidine kinase